MRKKNTIPSAFEDVLGNIGYSNAEGAAEVTNIDTIDSAVDVETITTNNEPDPVKEPEVKTTENNVDPVDNTEDNSTIPQEVLD